MSQELQIVNLGRITYQKAWDIQRSLQRSLIDGTGQQTLLLCEHDPVITVGRSAKAINLLVSEEALKSRGVELYHTERGGDFTYHGPGQLVGYPILNLNNLKRDVGWYMRTLEEVIIQTLQAFKVPSGRVQGRTGVWTEHPDDGSFSRQRKIASIGVRISRWCTLHGFGLNVLDCTDGFSLINPCGFTDIKMTSMKAERERYAESLTMISDNALVPDTIGVVEKLFPEIFGLSGVRAALPYSGVKV